MWYYQKSNNPDSTSLQGKKADKSPQDISKLGKTRELDKRRHIVLDMLVKGYSIYDIADRTNYDIEDIESDKEYLSKLSFKERHDDLDVLRTEVIMNARAVQRAAWQEFEHSKEPRITEKEENGRKGESSFQRKVNERKILPGDPRYLDIALKSGDQIATVSGAKKHKEFSVVNNVQNNQVDILSPGNSPLPKSMNRWTKKPDDVLSVEDREQKDIEE